MPDPVHIINIYKVTKEEDLDKILDNHVYKLVVVMFLTSNCILNINEILFKFQQIKKQKSDCFFVYIDISNYIDTSKKYTKELICLPRFHCYYNKQEICSVWGQNETMTFNMFARNLNSLIFRINNRNRKRNKLGKKDI